MTGITITGDKQLLDTFDSINDFDAWATPPMTRATRKLFERVKTYPPNRPGSRYQRTFTLQRSIDWNVESTRNGVTGHVYSSGANQGYGDYEAFVKVEGFQAEIHQGFWPTDVDDLLAEEPNIMDELSKAAAEVLR